MAAAVILLIAAMMASDPDYKATLPPGFAVKRLYAVPSDQGSWVSMTVDPAGRLIVSDQYGGLYRISTDVDPVIVEKLEAQIGFAQGLLYAFDSLYVVAHPGKFELVDEAGQRQSISRAAGLYRLRDTTGDGQFDQIRLLRKFEGEGEHGPHGVILSPDKKSLYLCAGNHTGIPHPESSRVPLVWQEDQITPRLPDAGGHAVGIMAPGGWVCQTDPDGKQFELISVGFRNHYDIAFSPQGELFTYDADMEWDIGLPWYRPTRICHVTSGSEFGWRNGSGKWPDYFPDSLPAVVDIGPGSPTGISFGTGAQFPQEFQNSLFVGDWSYGIIHRVQLQSRGASFGGTCEPFCSSPELPVTDMIINPRDGAMYFLTGGRRSQSALFRVTYHGPEPTSPAAAQPVDPLVELRRSLESLHTSPAIENVDTAWPRLRHSDRFVRFAARTAIELVPDHEWLERAWIESDPQGRLEALLAVIRTGGGDAQLQSPVVQSLGELKFDTLTEEQQLQLLRLYGLVQVRLGQPSTSTLKAIRDLSKHFPSPSERVNRELARVLAAAESEQVVSKTLDLMASAATQEQQIHYAIVIHAVQSGWTPDLQRRYLNWFVESAGYAGGSSFRQYLQNIRTAFAANLPTDQRIDLRELMLSPIEPMDPWAEFRARPVVKKWTLAELRELPLDSGNVEKGKQMFAIAQCYKCHMVNRQGGIVGPDLTNAGRRFSTDDLLRTVVEPDHEISDQYQATMFQLEDGRTITGRIANRSDSFYMVQEDMIRPGDLTRVETDTIEAMRPSSTSMMPGGLLDSLTRNEIVDLLAYLKSAAAAR